MQKGPPASSPDCVRCHHTQPPSGRRCHHSQTPGALPPFPSLLQTLRGVPTIADLGNRLSSCAAGTLRWPWGPGRGGPVLGELVLAPRTPSVKGTPVLSRSCSAHCPVSAPTGAVGTGGHQPARWSSSAGRGGGITAACARSRARGSLPRRAQALWRRYDEVKAQSQPPASVHLHFFFLTPLRTTYTVSSAPYLAP